METILSVCFKNTVYQDWTITEASALCSQRVREIQVVLNKHPMTAWPSK